MALSKNPKVRRRQLKAIGRKDYSRDPEVRATAAMCKKMR